MRIGLVIESFDPRRGGVEQWTAQFARWVAAAGHELHVVAKSFADGASAWGVTPHLVPAGSSRLEFATAAEEALRGLDLDVIHDTGCGWHCDVFQPHGGSRVASFEQNLLLAPAWMRPLRRMVAPLLSRRREFEQLTARQYGDPRRTFIAISKMVAADLQRYHGVKPERLRLVYNGVDLDRFSPRHRAEHRARVRAELRIADDEVLLLIVAHNFRLKGVPTLLRAVGRLGAGGRKVRVAVAGGKRFGSYRRLARRVGIGDAVTFLGSVDDPAPLYSAADAYVQPTFYDPCSLVVLEALASGLPVITSRFNGAGELMSAGVEGYVIRDPGSAAELAAAITPLLDLRLRQRMGAAARGLACQHSLERNCREVLAVYEEVRGQRRLAA